MNTYMIRNEKELEDYICNNVDNFIDFLNKTILNNKGNIRFIGRQVKIGNSNIADLVFVNEYEEKIPIGKNGELVGVSQHDYIIVELKYRELEPKDLAQLSRYINTLKAKLINECCEGSGYVYGVFVSPGMSREMEEISMLESLDNIYFANVISTLSFQMNNLCYKEEYISDLELDNRIKNIYIADKENKHGPTNND